MYVWEAESDFLAIQNCLQQYERQNSILRIEFDT